MRGTSLSNQRNCCSDEELWSISLLFNLPWHAWGLTHGPHTGTVVWFSAFLCFLYVFGGKKASVHQERSKDGWISPSLCSLLPHFKCTLPRRPLFRNWKKGKKARNKHRLQLHCGLIEGRGIPKRKPRIIQEIGLPELLAAELTSLF